MRTVNDNHEKLYTIALDMQKQLGGMSAEISKQSQMLVDLNVKVAIQNGKVASNQLAIQKLEGYNNVLKGKIIILTAFFSIVLSILIPILRDKLF